MIWAILRKEIKKMVKQKSLYFWTFGLPIMFIVVFASIFGNTNYSFTVHYIDLDQTESSKAFISSINKVDSFTAQKESESQQAISQVKDGKIQTLVIIPKGFGDSLASGSTADLQFYYDGTQGEAQSVQPVKALLTNFANGYREKKLTQAVSAETGNPQKAASLLSPPVKINETKLLPKKVNMITQIVPGYTVMFVFFIVITMARNFIHDRESGMLSRLFSTPMNRFQYMIGMWIPSIILVLVQVTVLLGFGYFVYNLQIGDAGTLFILSLVLSIATTSLGLLISFVAKSEQMAVGITQLITLGGAALGGLWVPIDLMPKTLQTIAQFIPQYWAHKAFISIMARGAHIGEIVPTLLYLAAFAAICLIIASLSYKPFVKGATS